MQIDSKLHCAKTGSDGELFVASWLNDHGFSILANNYRQRCGEIDLIAKKKNLLIFVEVKTRFKHYFNLSEVVDHKKQQKIILTARNFLSYYQAENMIFRFDIALLKKDGASYQIEYIENAFTASERY